MTLLIIYINKNGAEENHFSIVFLFINFKLMLYSSFFELIVLLISFFKFKNMFIKHKIENAFLIFLL